MSEEVEQSSTIHCDEVMVQASDSCLQEDEIDTLDTFIACVEGISTSHVPNTSNTGTGSTNLRAEDPHHQHLRSETNDDDEGPERISTAALEGVRTSQNDLRGDEEDAIIVACKTTEEVLESMVKSGYDMMTMCTGGSTQLPENNSQQTTPIHAASTIDGDGDDDIYCAICLAVPNLQQPLPAIAHNNVTGTASTTTVCPRDGFAHLPCCGGKDGRTEQTTSTKICTKCLLILCTPTSDGQASVGRCPRCRSWISISTSQEIVTITKASHAGQCNICYQVKAVLVPVDGSDNNNLCCDACYLGVRNPLLYQCQSCTQSQRIPHPMYRYQTDGPNQYGYDTWACQRCATFTKWKILPSQIHLIPPGDVPESWGEEFNAMVVARARVQRHHRGDPDNNQTYGTGSTSSCSIS